MLGIHFGLDAGLPLLLYLGGIIAFLCSVFWKPEIGLYLAIFTFPMQTGRYRIHQYPFGSSFLDILLLGAVLGLYRKGEKLRFNLPVAGYLCGLTALYYISLLQGSVYLNVPLPFSIADPRFSHWKNYVELFFLAIIVANVMRDKPQIVNCLLLMAASCLLVNRSYYNYLSEADLSHFSYEGRTAGALGYAGVNGFAAFEVMVVGLFWGVASYAKRFYLKLAAWGLAWTCIYCILYSYSRGAYLGLLATFIALGFLKERKLLIVAGAVVIFWTALLPSSVQERITMTTEQAEDGAQYEASAQTRVDLWTDAMDLFHSSPVVGIGFDTYEFLNRVGQFRDTHNYYVKILVETGAVGLLLFLVLLAKLGFSALTLFRRADDPFWKSIGLGFVGLLAGAMVTNFFGDRWTYQQVDGYLWIPFGFVMRGLVVLREKALEQPEPISEEGASGQVLAEGDAVAVGGELS